MMKLIKTENSIFRLFKEINNNNNNSMVLIHFDSVMHGNDEYHYKHGHHHNPTNMKKCGNNDCGDNTYQQNVNISGSKETQPTKHRMVRSMSPTSLSQLILSQTSTTLMLMVMMMMLMAQGCVDTETELQDAVSSANNRSEPVTFINLCAEMITITSQIYLENKNIELKCLLPNTNKKCTLDAQKISRHFLIEDSNILFNNIIFINGFVPDNDFGGSLSILNESAVDIIECDFFSNTAFFWAGAIFIQEASSNMENVTMFGNEAVSHGGAVCILLVTLT